MSFLTYAPPPDVDNEPSLCTDEFRVFTRILRLDQSLAELSRGDKNLGLLTRV